MQTIRVAVLLRLISEMSRIHWKFKILGPPLEVVRYNDDVSRLAPSVLNPVSKAIGFLLLRPR